MDKIQQIAPKDYMTSFGEVALASGTACENILNVNKADASRMKVNLVVTETATGGTSVVFKLQGSDDNSSYSDLAVTPSIALSALAAGANFAIPIPDGYNKKYLKVAVAKSGTFTAGKVEAAVDAYLGI